ncbi:MAG: hypothetical protein WCO84_03815 [bacterium]
MKNLDNLNSKIEKINIPKVKFELAPTKMEVDLIFNFCYPDDTKILNWNYRVYDAHPKLKEMVGGITDKNIFYNKCEQYFKKYLIENKDNIEKARDNFQEKWDEIAEKNLANLSKDFETKYPENIKEIKAYVSINPICPRFLDKWSFSLFYKFDDNTIKSVSIHEITHFLYFKKWLEVFPDSDKKKFDSPHSEWRLSEILASSIANNNKTIQGSTNNREHKVYKEWQDIKIGEKILSEYFGELYKEHENGKISFEDFLKKSWEEYQKHKDIIENLKK